MPIPVILISENDLLLRWSLKACLEEEGYQVLASVRGAEPASPQVRVVLLGLGRRCEEESEAIQEMRRRYPGADIIAMTADPQAEPARQVMRCGARHCIRKPFRLEDLLALVRSVAPLRLRAAR